MQGLVASVGDAPVGGEDHGWAGLGLGEGEGFGAFVVEVFGLELGAEGFEEFRVDLL